MVSIHRFPRFGKRFFKRICKQVGCCHFSHFWRAVLGLASLTGRKSVSKMTKLFGDRRTRQAIAHFLTEAEWDTPGLLLDSALSTLKHLGAVMPVRTNLWELWARNRPEPPGLAPAAQSAFIFHLFAPLHSGFC